MIFVDVATLAVLVILIIAVNKLARQRGERTTDGYASPGTDGSSYGGATDASNPTAPNHHVMHEAGSHHATHSDAGGTFGHGGDSGGGFDGGGHSGH